MNWIRTGVVAAAAVGGAVAVRRALIGGRRSSLTGAGAPPGRSPGGGQPRWHVLTVNRQPSEVAPDGRLPQPLADLGDTVEVQLRPAPGGRGTEVAVRLRDGEPSAVAARLRREDPRWAVRRALRDTRQLVETGEILSPDRPTTTRRTLLNRPLAFATRHGKDEGLL